MLFRSGRIGEAGQNGVESDASAEVRGVTRPSKNSSGGGPAQWSAWRWRCRSAAGVNSPGPIPKTPSQIRIEGVRTRLDEGDVDGAQGP